MSVLDRFLWGAKEASENFPDAYDNSGRDRSCEHQAI